MTGRHESSRVFPIVKAGTLALGVLLAACGEKTSDTGYSGPWQGSARERALTSDVVVPTPRPATDAEKDAGITAHAVAEANSEGR